MHLVCNANVLFAAILKDSATRRILTSPRVELHAPDLLRIEHNKFKKLLATKTAASPEDVKAVAELLLSIISIHEPSIHSLKEAAQFSPDIDDAAYLALCLDLNLPLWSNDKRLKNQKRVRIVTTDEILTRKSTYTNLSV